MKPQTPLKALLALDAATEVDRIAQVIRHQVTGPLRRRGAVVGISGGIDSSVVAALCVRALGPERVLGVMMPEADSLPESVRLGTMLAHSLGMPTFLEDITPILRGAGCYERRDEVIRKVVPNYNCGCRCKIVLPPVTQQRSPYRVFSLVVRWPDGSESKVRLSAETYRGIVAATNFKQRVRAMIVYYHADRLHYAVAGTPNLLEYDQGFFVKNGDGAADFKPIAHLYKSQVYQLAAYLGVPKEIQKRTPTTDTYPLEQTQEEFYFSLPLEQLDLCLYGRNNGLSPVEVAAEIGLTPAQVAQVYEEIAAKRKGTRYLHSEPLLAASDSGSMWRDAEEVDSHASGSRRRV